MTDGRRAEPTVAAREREPSDDEESSDGEFEFPFVSRDAGADEQLFAGDRVRAFYPVFGRVLDDAVVAPEREEPPPPRAAPLGRLFQLEQARTSSVASTSSSSSSSSAAELDGASPDSYCLWAPGSSPSPSHRLQRKSGSTGSASRWRRIGELVVGRSHSDGREKFLFLSAPPSPARDRDDDVDHHHAAAAAAFSSNKPNNATKKQQQQQQAARGGSKAVDTTLPAGRGRMAYSYGGGGSSSPGGARRTFLPYRQHLVGLFANVHGLSRSHHHPF